MPAPQIRLQGRWLEELGFKIGSTVVVEAGSGYLVIKSDGHNPEEKDSAYEGE